MLKIREAVAVEGRYDQKALREVVDTVILETDGFGIFSDTEKMALLRRVAEHRGLIILTDSDAAGFLIRGRIGGSIPKEYLKHAYVPDIYGREKRKRAPSKEGKLGVEGMDPEILERALLRAGATPAGEEREPLITKADLYRAGLSGKPEAAAKRHALKRALDLPERLSPNALLGVLNALFSRSEFLQEAASLPNAEAEIPTGQESGGP